MTPIHKETTNEGNSGRDGEFHRCLGVRILYVWEGVVGKHAC